MIDKGEIKRERERERERKEGKERERERERERKGKREKEREQAIRKNENIFKNDFWFSFHFRLFFLAADAILTLLSNAQDCQ